MRRLPPLTEYVPERAVPLSTSERDEVQTRARQITLTPSMGREGCYDLTPGSWIGAINTGSVEIEIRPKFPINRVLFLLSYTLDPRQWQDTFFAVREEESLLEAVIPAFVMHVRRAFQRGIVQGYRAEDAALATVRGRLRFDDQIRFRFGIFPPIEVRYDDFTEDIEINRLIKAAIACLGRLPLRSGEARGMLRAFDASLANVQHIHYDARNLPPVTYTRLNEHYRPAVELAKLILRSGSFDLHGGRVQASTFLINMNEVFEGFVVTALREALELSLRSFPREARGRALYLDESMKVALEPDLSWWERDKCVFVGDVKYKDAGTEGVVNADLYQLLAYATAANLPGGLLVYAAGQSELVTHRIKWAEKELYAVALSLNREPEDILKQVQPIVHYICHLRRRAWSQGVSASEHDMALSGVSNR